MEKAIDVERSHIQAVGVLNISDKVSEFINIFCGELICCLGSEEGDEEFGDFGDSLIISSQM